MNRVKQFPSTKLESIMKTAYLSLLAAVAATVSLAANAAPTTTDEARAEAAKRNQEAAHAAALRPLPADQVAIHVTDGESARLAAGQANARRAHDAHLEATLAAGAGIKSAPIKVTDTDTARAAAAQKGRDEVLVADYEDYKRMLAQDVQEPVVAANK